MADAKPLSTMTFEIYSEVDENGEPQITSEVDFRPNGAALEALGVSLVAEATIAIVKKSVEEGDLDQLQALADQYAAQEQAAEEREEG